MKHLLTAALIATALASPVRGEDLPLTPRSIGEFVEYCEVSDTFGSLDPRDNRQQGWCMGFVDGLSLMLTYNCAEKLSGNDNIWLASDLSGVPLIYRLGQMLEYAIERPEIASDNIFSLAIALRNEWPCG